MRNINNLHKITTIILVCVLTITSIMSVIPPLQLNNTEKLNTDIVTEGVSDRLVNDECIFINSLYADKISYLNNYAINYIDISNITGKFGSIILVEDIYTSTSCEPSLIPDTEEEESTSSVNDNSDSEDINVEDTTTVLGNEETKPEEVPETSEAVEETTTEETTKPSDLYSEEDIYELAKIIMCEAEGESQKCKEYVGQVVLNRLKSGRYGNTIHSVIFANNGKTYQFSPVKKGGRWWKVEPNQECYDAAYTVLNASTPITNAYYFEDCKGESWHSRTLTKVAEIDGMRFYIE